MYLTSLRHIGQRTLRFLLLGTWLHEEFIETRATKCMSTMDEYSWYVVPGIIISFTKLACIFIDKFSDKFLYFWGKIVGDLLSLLKKESCGVLKFLHGLFIIFKFYINLSIETCLNIEIEFKYKYKGKDIYSL